MKGQVSFFIIIGILGVIAVVAGMLIFSTPTTVTPPSEHTSDFVTLRSCIDSEFADSILVAALNGGIIEMSSYQRRNGAFFEPIPGYEFPLWNKNSISYIPDKSELEAGLEKELLDRIEERCLRESGIDPRTTAQVSVTLSENSNNAEVAFEGEFIEDGSRTRIPSVRVDNNLPLLQTYNVAVSLAEHLLSSGILVGLNQNIIELSPDVPTSGMSFSCRTQQWRKSQVQKDFEKGLELYAPYLRFDNNPSVVSDIASRHFTFDVPAARTPGIDVRANYHNSFGMLFDAEKSQGDIMTSFVTMNPDSPGICQNHYSFWYSVEYPLVFTVQNSGSSIPFEFRMALYNEVYRNILDEPPARTGVQDYCRDTTFRRAKINLRDDQGTTILNAFARIRCGNEECVVRTDSNGIINDYLPRRCIRGTMTIEKEGYQTATVNYDASDFTGFNGQTVVMPKLRTIKLSFSSDDYDISSFFFTLVHNGRWTTFDIDTARISRDYIDVEFQILKVEPAGNLVVVYGPDTIPNNDDLTININTQRLYDGQYSTAVDVVRND